ncbi:hypothetical protein [Dyella sp.]|uniref:hypothetical protein n=1 Tax=Dyella sp. TaxID=1869338 RepID=UPI002ED60EE9
MFWHSAISINAGWRKEPPILRRDTKGVQTTIAIAERLGLKGVDRHATVMVKYWKLAVEFRTGKPWMTRWRLGRGLG